MLRQILTSLRHVWRDKQYSLLLAAGVAVASASCMLIGFYVRHHVTYDSFHEDSDQIAQVFQDFDGNYLFSTGVKMGPLLVDQFPQIHSQVRMYSRGGLVRLGNDRFPNGIQEDRIAYVDSNLFEFFSFQLVEGDVKSALKGPSKVVLTKSKAEAYFGDYRQAIGEEIVLDDQFPCIVSGICEDLPANSTIQAELFISFLTMNLVLGTPSFESWWWPAVYTFVRTQSPEDIGSISMASLDKFAVDFRGEGTNVYPRLSVFEEGHLYGVGQNDGEIGNVWLFSIIGVIILMIAIINYVNLVTARGSIRALEVGVKKTLGASRGFLIRQFIIESWIICLVAILVSTLLVELVLPWFESIAEVEGIRPWSNFYFWLILLGISILMAMISGIYPAMVLSAFSPSRTIRNQVQLSAGGLGLRKILVGVQFVATITLLACTMIIFNQHEYLLSKDLGFEQKNLVSIDMSIDQAKASIDPMMNELKQNPLITNVGAANWSPATGSFASFPVEIHSADGKEVDVENAGIIYLSSDYLETMGISVVAGRAIHDSIGDDFSAGFLVNEVAANMLGGADKVLEQNMRIYYGEFGKLLYEKKGVIRGVVEDFHFQSLRISVKPVILTLGPTNTANTSISNLLVRMEEGREEEAMARIGQSWEETVGRFPFDFQYVDEAISENYTEEEKLGELIGYFSAIALFLACLGLIGLAAFTTAQKAKEIGIRKILGAGTGQILNLLTKEFVLVLIVGTMISWVLSYWLTDKWMESYPFTADMNFLPYLLAAVLSAGLVWGIIFTMGFREIKKNPAESLRQE